MSALKLVVNNEVEIKFVKIEDVSTAVVDLPPEKRKAWHQDGWRACNTCGYSVTYGFINTKAAEVIAQQGVTGLWFYKRDEFLGSEGYGAIFCRYCQKSNGWNAMAKRRYKKMSAAWTKKNSYSGF